MPSIRRTLTIFAMPVSPARILEDLSPFYRQEEFPVLLHQCETWAESRPLEGCRVIDASPVFRNTCAKYAALLAAGEPLPEKNRDHQLSGDYALCRECHITPDWLLIYEVDGNELILYLTRTGSHSDLF